MALKIKESFDTNIILRLMLKDIPGQCCRLQDLFMRANIQYHVADLAITEAVYVMESNYHLSREKIVDGIQRLLLFPGVNYNQELFRRVFPMYLEQPKLSFNDCCLVAYAALNEAEPLWTFDRDLAKVSGTAKLLG